MRLGAAALVVFVAAIVTPSARLSTATEKGSIAVVRNGGIVLVNAAGRKVATLTSHAGWEDWAPAWSPDARRIAFTRTTDGNRSFRIFVMRADGSGARQITRGRFDESPAWSPDCRWIAYSSTDGVRVVRPDGTGAHVAVREWPATDPSWTPDARLTYSFHPEDSSEWPSSCATKAARCGWVWATRADGRDRWPVLRGRDAHWSLDGRTIVYTLPDGGVATKRATGGGARLLGKGYRADWSADGRQIVFARLGLAAGGDSVWVMNRDGTGRHRIAEHASMPAWRPGSRG